MKKSLFLTGYHPNPPKSSSFTNALCNSHPGLSWSTVTQDDLQFEKVPSPSTLAKVNASPPL